MNISKNIIQIGVTGDIVSKDVNELLEAFIEALTEMRIHFPLKSAL